METERCEENILFVNLPGLSGVRYTVHLPWQHSPNLL